jgi:probable HAF family extracellular repeat protein
MFLLGSASFLVLFSEEIPLFQPTSEPARCDILDIGGHLMASDLNDQGQVVGLARSHAASPRAFLWSREGGLNYLDRGDQNGSVANSINSTGIVAGQLGREKGDRAAFLWNDNLLGPSPHPEFGPESMAFDVNSKGQVVGHVMGGDDLTRLAFLFDPQNGLSTLGTLGGRSSQAVGISEEGKVIGWSNLENNLTTRAFLWSASEGMTDLGTLGGASSYANALNNRGEIVGQAQTAGSQFHAYLHDCEEMKDLGTLGGQWSLAFAVNDQGLVVGQADPARHVYHTFRKKGWNMLVEWMDLQPLGDEASAVAWKDGRAVNLNDLLGSESDWDTLVAATGVNNRGEITGFGLKNGFTHAFLMTLDEGFDQPAEIASLPAAWAASAR